MIAGPGNTMPGSADRARALARERQAVAVVWISQSDEGPALWMYDATRDRVAARRLSTSPPFDPAAAASVALIVKTLLRLSDVPPPSERVQEPGERHWLHIGLLAGARLPPISDGSVEPRLGLRAIVWPQPLGGWLGGGLEITSGPGLGVDGDDFRGHWTETVVLAALHGRALLGSNTDAGLAAGAGMDITTLNGSAADSAEQASVLRANAVAAAHAEIGWRFSPGLRLGLRAGLVHRFRTQTYLVRGETVLEAKPLIFDGMLALELGLP
jgi:hypothetical protein